MSSTLLWICVDKLWVEFFTEKIIKKCPIFHPHEEMKYGAKRYGGPKKIPTVSIRR